MMVQLMTHVQKKHQITAIPGCDVRPRYSSKLLYKVLKNTVFRKIPYKVLKNTVVNIHCCNFTTAIAMHHPRRSTFRQEVKKDPMGPSIYILQKPRPHGNSNGRPISRFKIAKNTIPKIHRGSYMHIYPLTYSYILTHTYIRTKWTGSSLPPEVSHFHHCNRNVM